MRSNTGKDPEIDHALKREINDLQDGAAELKIRFSEDQLQRFREYLVLLHDFQGRVHLLSRQDNMRIARRHMLPSLMARGFLHRTRLCDIGSGGGFPGIPLAIMDRDRNMALFESIEKKAAVLEKVKDKLALNTLEIIHGRAEYFEGDRFDTILLRAVGTIKKNLKLIDNLLTHRGRAIFYKTHEVEQELKQAQPLMVRLGFHADIHRLYTPLEQRPLAFVILERKDRKKV